MVMTNFFKICVFAWLSGMVCFYTGACGKKSGLMHTVPVVQDVKGQLAHGEKLYTEGEYDQATDVFKEILNHDPGNVDAHYRLGVIYGKLGDMKKSAQEFENVLSIDPTHHKAFYNLGAIYASQGSLYSVSKATDNFKRYLRLDPYSENRKQIIDWLKSHGQTIDNIEPIIGTDKNDRASENDDDMISQADTYVAKQSFDKAESLYKAVLDRNPRHAIALYKLGVMYVKQGSFVKGRTELLKAISIDPNFSKAYFNLGILYSTQGETYDVEKAEFFFKKYLTLEPDALQKEKINAWLRTHEDIDTGRIFRNNLEKPGTTFSDDSPVNLKSWLEKQAGEISNGKETN